MADTENPNGQAPEDEDNTPNDAEGTDPQDAIAPTDGDEGNEPPNPGDEGGKEDELPEWARKSLTRANEEAARTRIELKEAREKLAESKSVEEVDKLLAELQTKAEQAEINALKERAGRKFGLPDALVARLSGSTEEEILEDAKGLSALLGDRKQGPPAPPNPTGGRTPRGDGTEYDPEAEWKKAKRLR